MRRWLWLLPLILGLPLYGQTSPGVVRVGTAPSGACPQGVPGQLVTSTGHIWTCQNITSGTGTWTDTGTGGGGTGTVTSVSVTTANGVSGSVANPTTTPAISLTLGAINPTTVNGVAISSLAPLASPSLTGVPTVPTAAPGTNTTQAASTAFVSAAATLPTATAVGQELTATAAGNTYTAQIPLGGTTWLYPVEWYGAVGDATGAAGVGTDNTTAIQACLTAVAAAGKGQCLLQAKKYRITSALTISKSSVGIAGTSYGAWSTSQSNQLSASAPLSALVIDSATADAVDASGGALATPISFNKFNDFTIIRTVAASASANGCGTGAGPAGLSIQFAGGFVVDRVWSEDSACNFFFQNAGAYGTGYVSNSGAMWAANGFNPTIPVYGFFASGLNSLESLRIRDSFAQTLYPGFSGVQSVGLIVTGSNINDVFVRGFETAFVTYGEYIQYTGGSASNVGNSDIHLIDCINDTFFQDGVVLDGLVSSQASEVEIKGGWNSTGQTGSANNSAGVWVKGSSGVTITATGFINLSGVGSGQKYGVLASTGTINRLAITGNNFYNMGNASIALNGVSGAAVTGNIINSSAGDTQTMIQGVTLTRSSIAGNSLSGTASFGITLDAASNNNDVEGLNAVDPTSITTPYSNAGTNNGLIGALNGNTYPGSAGFTSGGIPYYSSTSAESSSALLTNHGLLVGGGAGAAPSALGVGGANFPLLGVAAANPAFSTIAYPTSLTSGGVVYGSSTTQLASSALLTNHGLLVGGGAGAAPAALAVGGANFPLLGVAAANPAFSTIAYPTALTSGGIVYGSSTTQLASSALLTANAVVIGGGAGVAPSTIPASTTATQALFATATAPAFRALAATDLPATAQLTISTPTGTPTFTPGTNVTSVVCAASYTCTNQRGELTIVGGTATTGTIATVNFSTTLTTAPGLCMVNQQGGGSLFDIGHGVPSTTNFTITAGVSVAASTVTVDYICQL